MKERILRNWTALRVFYTLMGLVVCAASVQQREWGGLLFGGYFLSMGVFAFGCAAGNCYGGSCRTPVSRRKYPSRSAVKQVDADNNEARSL